jgi:hypothetical protein
MITRTLSTGQIARTIFLIRGEKVMLDYDFAALYGVTTGTLNKAGTRNRDRFPADFMFKRTPEESQRLIFQIGISKGRGGRHHRPYAFTEHVRETAPRYRTRRAR